MIAVVGMAGLFPGAADLRAYWQNIISKFGATHEAPGNRWIADRDSMVSSAPTPDRALNGRCCLVDRIDINPSELNLPPALINDLDPLYRMVLDVGCRAVSQPSPITLNRKRTGVVLAAIALPTETSSAVTRDLFRAFFEKQLFGHSAYRLPSENRRLAAGVTAMPAAILARALELGGGAYTLDAACASSLYAVKLACEELIAQRSDAMLAGGVSRPDCLYTQVGFSQLRALSPSGRCAPFDHSADGLVVGEGAGVLVLKRLEDALADNDRIHGVIHGIGLSNDMRGNLLAPESSGQVRAMRAAYTAAGWQPTDIDLIECHGAGTPVGDTTELNSLRTLWGDTGWTPGQCAIGSVKSMIGHLLTAAGAAGIIKTLLALKEKTLPPSLNFERPPENSPLTGSPFRVQTDADQWPARQDHRRRAAVSAFGFGGINGHLLLEEWGDGSQTESWPIAHGITNRHRQRGNHSGSQADRIPGDSRGRYGGRLWADCLSARVSGTRFQRSQHYRRPAQEPMERDRRHPRLPGSQHAAEGRLHVQTAHRDQPVPDPSQGNSRYSATAPSHAASRCRRHGGCRPRRRH